MEAGRAGGGQGGGGCTVGEPAKAGGVGGREAWRDPAVHVHHFFFGVGGAGREMRVCDREWGREAVAILRPIYKEVDFGVVGPTTHGGYVGAIAAEEVWVSNNTVRGLLVS